jgi:hypothetical protein
MSAYTGPSRVSRCTTSLNRSFRSSRSIRKGASGIARVSNPAFLGALETQAAPWLIRDSMRAVQLLPSLIAAERTSLGMSQMEIAIEDCRNHRLWADRTASDPKAVHLAVELPSQIALTEHS